MANGSRRLESRHSEARYHASRLPGLRCCTLLRGGAPRANVHDRLTLLALTAGEALVWCRGETHALKPGSVLLIQGGDVQRDLHETRYCAASVMLRADLLNALSGADAGVRLASSVAHSVALSAEILTLVEAVQTGRCIAEQERLTARVLGQLAPFWTDTPARLEPPLVTRARRALAQSASASLSLEALADRLRCSPAYLCRLFSEHLGIGPHAYQLQLRLLEAARLMESGHTVARAASLAGFSDASHLRRHFQRRFATAPGHYRQELGEDPRKLKSVRSRSKSVTRRERILDHPARS